MEIDRREQSAGPFAPPAEDDFVAELDLGLEQPAPVVVAGWGRLRRVAVPPGSTLQWQVEMLLNGTMQSRRFANELHARWWLAAVAEPCHSPSRIDEEELNARWRTGVSRRG